MSDIAIRVENLSKLYHIGAAQKRHDTLKDAIADFRLQISDWVRFDRKAKVENRKSDDTIWALKDVSFEVKRGEVVGIIGRNGAGKSTLLKILSRITEPTKGRAIIDGRVGSLLEVGTGFHPELTGRENIYLNGAILGMKKAEIERKFDEMVAFAEIEKFLDTPVKHYSSGMYVRLAFAVAAHTEPEILLVDEVLAVGDVAFQKKCLGKMGDVAREGRTVLFVSHSMASVASLCEIGLNLEAGLVKSIGPVDGVIENYLTSLVTKAESANLRQVPDRRGTGEVKIVEARILNHEGNSCSTFKYGDTICFEFTLEPVSAILELIQVVWIRTSTGTPVLHLASHDDPSWHLLKVENRTTLRCVITDCQLYPGNYLVSLWIGTSHRHDVDFVMDVLKFRVEQGELLHRGFDMSWTIGIYHVDSCWSLVEEATNHTG